MKYRLRAGRVEPENKDTSIALSRRFEISMLSLTLEMLNKVGEGRVRWMKVVAENRRARFDFELLEEFEAGIMLTGQEVKSCRMGQVNLAGSYVSFLRNKAMIKHMKISAYKQAGPLPDYEPERDRELLVSKNERNKLLKATEEKGMSLIPLEVRAGKYIKVVIAVAKGKKKADKRQTIRDKEVKRKIREGKEW